MKKISTAKNTSNYKCLKIFAVFSFTVIIITANPVVIIKMDSLNI